MSVSKRATLLLGMGMDDVSRSLKIWRFWSKRAKVRFRLEYQGSKLGKLWAPLNVLVVALVLGLIWGVLLGRKDGPVYICYLLAGFPVWQLISRSVNASSGIFRNKVIAGDLPLTTPILEEWIYGVLQFLAVLPVSIVVCMLLGISGLSNIMYLPLAVVSLVLWSLGIMTIISFITLIWPDIRHLVRAIMRLSFLATPIIWEVARLGAYQKYIWLNPFFPVLEFARYSISGTIYIRNVIWVAPLSSLVACVVGFAVLSRFVRQGRLGIL